MISNRRIQGVFHLAWLVSLQVVFPGCAESPRDFEGDIEISEEVDDIGVDSGTPSDPDDPSTASEGEDSEKCADDSLKDTPGLCGCEVSDDDSDGDGVPDCNDECPADPEKVTPEFCGCGRPDNDNDGDGILDCEDGCPGDSGKADPGICGCGVADKDSDGDGVMDCQDGCPLYAGKSSPGICGCEQTDGDSDGDGIVNCHDGCSGDPFKVAPGLCGCGRRETSCSLKCLQAPEHALAVLACEGERLIDSIEFASFGDPNGTCAAGNPSVGDCHGDKSTTAIEKMCLGKNQCGFVVENTVLGDPHCGKGTDERLIVQFLCRDPTSIGTGG